MNFFVMDLLKIKTKFQSMVGYTLLEILIALCILSVGLLGFAHAQLLALRNNQTAYLQSIAQIRLTSLAETLQACAIIHCTSASLNNELNNWNQLNSYLLPTGQGELTRQNNHQLIFLRWQTNVKEQNFAQVKLLIPFQHL